MSRETTIAAVQIGRRLGIAARPRPVPRQQYPHLIELHLARMLLTVVSAAARAFEPLLDEVATASAARVSQLADTARAAVRDAIAVVVPQFAGIARQVDAHQLVQLDRQVRAGLGIPAGLLPDMQLQQPRMDAQARIAPDVLQGFVHENVALIKSLGDTPVAEVEQLVTRAFGAGDRHERLAREIADRFHVAESRARLIAVDQIGKLNGRISAERHMRMGLTDFIWRSVHDKRVRPLHRALDGQRFSYAKLPREGLPGTPVRCRCHDEPIFDDVLAELDRLEAVRPAPAPKVRRGR